MDRHAAYVAMSRHRGAAMLRYGREEFATYDKLVASLENVERPIERALDRSR